MTDDLIDAVTDLHELLRALGALLDPDTPAGILMRLAQQKAAIARNEIEQ